MRRCACAVGTVVWASLIVLQGCMSSGSRTQPTAMPWTDSSLHRIRFVPVAPGVRLEVLDWGGSGPPLVFLAGLQDVAHGFDDLAPHFIDRHHVLAITRRGYGASSQPDSGYDLASRVADLRAVLDSLRLPRVALVGHSIAGDELTAFAGAYPERVTGLVYLDAAYDHSGLPDLLGQSPAPPPMLAPDSASARAVQAYLQRAFGMHIPEAQLRAIGRYDAAGRLVGNVTPAVTDSLILVGCGHPDYVAVRAPALVIYAVIDSVQTGVSDLGYARHHRSRRRATVYGRPADVGGRRAGPGSARTAGGAGAGAPRRQSLCVRLAFGRGDTVDEGILRGE